MGQKRAFIVLKLGGSLITHKDKPLSPNLDAIKAVARSIRQASQTMREKGNMLFLVHGGGSFGHYYARKYHLSAGEFSESRSTGVAKTAGAMEEIHNIILKELLRNGLNCKTIEVSELLDWNGTKLSSSGKRKLLDYFAEELVPVSFGNVLVTNAGATIVSGDTLCNEFTKYFATERVIFAMDVDGIYKTPSLEGAILSVLSPSTTVSSALRKFDVTGGVRNKVDLAFDISSRGTNVFFVNGSKGRRMTRCLCGELNMKATRIIPSFSARLKNATR